MLIPPPYHLLAKALAAAAAVAACFAAGWVINGWRMESAIERVMSEAAQAQARAQAQQRAEEARRNEAIKEVEHVARMARDRADIDRRAADQQHLRLLDAARAAAKRGAGQDPAAAAGGPPTEGGCELLADVFGEVDRAAGELAAALDASRIAGAACEAAYERLTGD